GHPAVLAVDRRHRLRGLPLPETHRPARKADSHIRSSLHIAGKQILFRPLQRLVFRRRCALARSGIVEGRRRRGYRRRIRQRLGTAGGVVRDDRAQTAIGPDLPLCIHHDHRCFCAAHALVREKLKHMAGLAMLSVVIWLPILAGLAVLFTGSDRNANLARWLALTGAIAGFIVALPLYS